MQRVTILSTFPSSADFEPFSQGETTFTFEHLSAAGPRRLIEGQGWAFIDWIMPDLSGLEMCRRLRADQRTRARSGDPNDLDAGFLERVEHADVRGGSGSAASQREDDPW